METPIISYNLRERGRQHTGQPRSFDIPRLVAAINGDACQERVRNREMFGWYGHWPRIKFGMLPSEGGIAGGKAQAIDPALVTTHLRAHDDGTVEHKAEFLPTPSGEIATKLFKARTGGFSSAIDERKPELFGFDYVLAPNYTTNRGYSLDSVLCEGGACELGMDFGDIDSAILEEQIAAMSALLDATDSGRSLADEAMRALEQENAALRKALDEAKQKPRMDDAKPRGPLVVSSDRLRRMQADTEAFLTTDSLPMPQRKPRREAPRDDPAMSRIMQRMLG